MKRELLEGARTFPDIPTANRAVFRRVNPYSTRGRRSAIGNLSLNAHETNASAAIAEAA
ncbi:MAG: hypothetical protein QM630_09835 [Microbacterium sp.]